MIGGEGEGSEAAKWFGREPNKKSAKVRCRELKGQRKKVKRERESQRSRRRSRVVVEGKENGRLSFDFSISSSSLPFFFLSSAPQILQTLHRSCSKQSFDCYNK